MASRTSHLHSPTYRKRSGRPTVAALAERQANGGGVSARRTAAALPSCISSRYLRSTGALPPSSQPRSLGPGGCVRGGSRSKAAAARNSSAAGAPASAARRPAHCLVSATGLVMDNRGEDEHAEELDFHLGSPGDSSSDDENTSSNSSLSSMGKDTGGDAHRDAPGDGDCTYEKDIFTRMTAGAEMNNTLDEYWDIVKKTFATEGEAFIFYNNYARDKGFSVRKQKINGIASVARTLPKYPDNVADWGLIQKENNAQQTYGYSCGLFAIKYMELWNGTKLKKRFTQKDILKFRKQMAAELIFSEANLAKEKEAAEKILNSAADEE